jgi:hypothetical protein
MTTMKMGLLLLAVLASGIYTSGCTRYNPKTGQQHVDVSATADVAGLALGATALGVVASNRNDYYRGDVVVVNHPPVYRPYRGGYYQGGRKGGYYRR